MTSSLDSGGELSLMISAGSGSSARENLCSLGDVLAELSDIFIVNVFRTVYAESANLFAGLLGETCIVFHNKTPFLRIQPSLSEGKLAVVVDFLEIITAGGGELGSGEIIDCRGRGRIAL